MGSMIVCRNNDELAAFEATVAGIEWIGQNCENHGTEDAYVSKAQLTKLMEAGTRVLCDIWVHEENGVCADFYMVREAA